MSNIDTNIRKEANILAGDAIKNYKTVASFGHHDVIIKEYDR